MFFNLGYFRLPKYLKIKQDTTTIDKLSSINITFYTVENKIHTCNASWFIVFKNLPCSALSASWYLHVCSLWDFFGFFIWRRVPRQYFVNDRESGWTRGLSLTIAFSNGGSSEYFKGSTSGQSTFLVGSFSDGFSKQPCFSPKASSLNTGYRLKLCLKLQWMISPVYYFDKLGLSLAKISLIGS